MLLMVNLLATDGQWKAVMGSGNTTPVRQFSRESTMAVLDSPVARRSINDDDTDDDIMIRRRTTNHCNAGHVQALETSSQPSLRQPLDRWDIHAP